MGKCVYNHLYYIAFIVSVLFGEEKLAIKSSFSFTPSRYILSEKTSRIIFPSDHLILFR